MASSRVAVKVRLNQIYQSRRHAHIRVEIVRKAKNDKWKARILTERPGVYSGTHTLAKYTLEKEFTLIEKSYPPPGAFVPEEAGVE